MEKLKMHTPDLTQDHIARIREMFPNCVTEARDESGKLKLAVDFDLLKQELSGQIVEGPQERYHLNWPGKREALLTANAPIAKTLRPARDESVNFDTTKNLFIEGDNLEALKLLQETYLGKIKMIYIDPPYNTGNDFIYEDDFSEDVEEFLIRSNQKDEIGARLVANTESNGRFHSDWLSFIYPRLKLARNLLRDDGIIFVSIDDGELKNLRFLCDIVFGEENFIDTICWKKKYGGGAKEKYLVSVHEYILVYAKNKLSLPEILVAFDEQKARRFYKFKDDKFDTLGYYRTHPLEAVKSFDLRDNLRFPVKAPDGTDVWPKRQWRWSKDRFNEALEKDEVIFAKNNDGEWVLSSKQYLNDESGEQRKTKAQSLIDDIYTQEGTKEIFELFGDAKIFSFPKPVGLMKRLIEIGGAKDSDIVLDFFAGSATMADALLQVNAEQEYELCFILIQLPEVVEEKSEAFKAGYKTIAEISKERIRRAGKKIIEGQCHEGWNKDIGFRVLKIDTSNMADIYYVPDAVKQSDLLKAVDNIKPDRTGAEDLLFQVLLDWGVDLTLPIAREKIAGKQVYFVDDNALAACFDTGISEDFVKELAARKPLRVVFRDNGFANDAVKINVDQIFKQLSPATEVRSI